MHKTHYILLIATALTLVAAVPRFYELGSIGFYGDEETTAFPARAFAEGSGTKMPSGMPYRRALPFTWLNGLAAHYLGKERELAYRLPAAIFGTLTIPLLFLLARPLVGEQVALLASVLLAFSEWHIATSREARMYAPFYVAMGTNRKNFEAAGRYFAVFCICLASRIRHDGDYVCRYPNRIYRVGARITTATRGGRRDRWSSCLCLCEVFRKCCV
jgi:hypothetical protein